MQEILLEIRKEDYKKDLKKLTLFFFRTQSLLRDKIIKNNYSTSACPFESGKCGKEGKKLQKSEYLKNEKSFLDEIKNTFHSF